MSAFAGVSPSLCFITNLGHTPPRGYGAFSTTGDSVSISIITFPEPGAMTEPFFVAAVFRPAGPGSELEEIARWFALEYTIAAPQMDAKAFFCEWTSDCKHLNRGQHTEITHEAFVAAVRAMLEPEPDP